MSFTQRKQSPVTKKKRKEQKRKKGRKEKEQIFFSLSLSKKEKELYWLPHHQGGSDCRNGWIQKLKPCHLLLALFSSVRTIFLCNHAPTPCHEVVLLQLQAYATFQQKREFFPIVLTEDLVLCLIDLRVKYLCL